MLELDQSLDTYEAMYTIDLIIYYLSSSITSFVADIYEHFFPGIKIKNGHLNFFFFIFSFLSFIVFEKKEIKIHLYLLGQYAEINN